jgi:hypothetical protein
MFTDHKNTLRYREDYQAESKLKREDTRVFFRKIIRK